MYNKYDIIEEVWRNPAPATGLDWEFHGSEWRSRQAYDGSLTARPDKTTLSRRGNSIFMHTHTDDFAADLDIFDFAKWLHNTNDFAEICTILGEAYHLTPDYSQYTEQQRQAIAQRRVKAPYLDEMGKYFIAMLNAPQGAKTREYLHGRGLEVSPRLGAFGAAIIEGCINHLNSLDQFKGVSIAEIRRNVEALIPEHVKHNADNFVLVLPYFNGNKIVGFSHRYTGNEAIQGGKYRNTAGLEKAGYCHRLNPAEPVVIVEGYLDAERCMQAGITNVFALGGVAPTDNPAEPQRSNIHTLQRYAVKRIIYVPDYEREKIKDAEGNVTGYGAVKTKATEDTIKAILPHLTTSTDGKGFISLRIADLRNNDGYKDADDYIRAYGSAAFRYQLENAPTWYEWELKKAASTIQDTDELRAAALATYCRISSPLERETLRQAVTKAESGYLATLKEHGFTAAALLQVDKHGVSSTYRERVTAGVEKLKSAVDSKATQEQISELISSLNRIQSQDSAASFASQMGIQREQVEEMIRTRPDYLETCWDLYSEVYDKSQGKTTKKVRRISFAPAAVTFLAAAVNHGKTLFLMQTALYLTQVTKKRFIYISVEEDVTQLYVRALTAYIGNKWGNVENPRGEIRKQIRSNDLPMIFDNGRSTLDAETAKYWREIAPYLRLCYNNGADITALKNFITSQVEEWQAQGIEVGGVFIDYVQMLHYNGKNYSRTDEMKGICNELNDLAKVTGLPIVLAAQLNRETIKEGIDAISLQSLGESSELEKIANDIFILVQVDKIPQGSFTNNEKGNPAKPRLNRCFNEDYTRKDNRLYIENIKARDYRTGTYCLLEYNGAAGSITLCSEY